MKRLVIAVFAFLVGCREKPPDAKNALTNFGIASNDLVFSNDMFKWSDWGTNTKPDVLVKDNTNAYASNTSERFKGNLIIKSTAAHPVDFGPDLTNGFVYPWGDHNPIPLLQRKGAMQIVSNPEHTFARFVIRDGPVLGEWRSAGTNEYQNMTPEQFYAAFTNRVPKELRPHWTPNEP